MDSLLTNLLTGFSFLILPGYPDMKYLPIIKKIYKV